MRAVGQVGAVSSGEFVKWHCPCMSLHMGVLSASFGHSMAGKQASRARPCAARS